MKTKPFLERNATRLLLIALTLIGALGAAMLSAYHSFWPTFFEHLFMAFAVAGVIGLCIDLTLHQHFARNVFEAAIGYLLPEQLRGELRWIYNQPFLCRQHVQRVRIKRIPGTSWVSVRTEMTRELANITAVTQEFKPGLAVNEWFCDGHQSKIIRCSVRQEGEAATTDCAQRIFYKNDKTEVAVGGDPVRVGSGKSITASYEFEETLQDSDLTFTHFAYSTTHVSVVVDADEDIEPLVLFSTREGDPALNRVSASTWQLNGVLLPLQAIRVLWYPKNKYESWLATRPPALVKP